MGERLQVRLGEVSLAVESCGSGEPVVLIPSWARGGQDFASLARALVQAGFRAVAVNPRGVAGSRGPLYGISLHDLAADVAGVVEALEAVPAHVVGHALGNRIARCLAADRPELVRSVTLLAAGGQVAPARERLKALERTLTEALDDDQWLAAMRACGFFASGSNPMVWRHGWYPEVAGAQAEASRATPAEEWRTAGAAPLLVIQGLEDGLAVPENGRALREELGNRVRLVEIERAGHALLPERPRAVAEALVLFLRGLG